MVDEGSKRPEDHALRAIAAGRVPAYEPTAGATSDQSRSSMPDEATDNRYGSDSSAREAVTFDQVYTRYKDMVAAVTWHVLGAQGEVEDVVQNVFLEIFRSLDRFRGESSISTWVYRVTVNVALQEVRRRSRKRWLRLFGPDENTDVAAPEDLRRQIESRSSLQRLGRALDKVSPKKRAVFVLVEIEGLSPQEAADVLGVPHNTVRSRLIAARSEVTQRLAKEGVLDV